MPTRTDRQLAADALPPILYCEIADLERRELNFTSEAEGDDSRDEDSSGSSDSSTTSSSSTSSSDDHDSFFRLLHCPRRFQLSEEIQNHLESL